MKKIYSFLAIALLALSPVLLTSCDTTYYEYDRWEDERPYYSNNALLDMAQNLRGKWDGNVVAQGRVNGQLVTERFFTEIEFDQYDMNQPHGRGIQYDYASVDAPQAELVRKFTWSINRYGDIILIYDKDNFKMTIPYNELNLDPDRFSGMMYGDNDTEQFAFSRYTLTKKSFFMEEESDSISKSK